MASKNLGAVIQRAISDGAFRRQLQSDPAAALRGFNLTPDEVAAIRGGDSSKLMSLGVDQRMSKAFAVFGQTSPSARSTLSDGTASAGSSAVIDGGTQSTREGIVGDPTSNSRSALDTTGAGSNRDALTTGDTASTSDAHSIGSASGTRALHGDSGGDTRSLLNDPTAAGTKNAIPDPSHSEFGARLSDGGFVTREMREGDTSVSHTALNENLAAADAGRGGSLAGDMSVASHMTNPSLGSSTSALNTGGTDIASSSIASGTDFIDGTIHQDPGDVTGSGNAIGDSGSSDGPDGASHSWG